MIARAPFSGSNHNDSWHAGFLELLPSIERHARLTFRHLRPRGKARDHQRDAKSRQKANSNTHAMIYASPQLRIPLVVAVDGG